MSEKNDQKKGSPKWVKKEFEKQPGKISGKKD
jgi:hypothetical protein